MDDKQIISDYMREMGKKGGTKKWEKVSKKERSRIMSEVAKRPRKKKELSTE